MNMIERPSGAYENYEYLNDSGAALIQYQFCLKLNPDAVSFPCFGYIMDDQGVADEAYGLMRSEPGSTWQIDQIDNSVVNLNRDDALYMTPGSGNLHAVALEGDYLVCFLIENQQEDDWVKVRLTPPVIAIDET